MPRLLVGSLFVLSTLALNACDKKQWEFDCTAVWSRGDKELSTKIYTYKDAEDERHATERCKKDMMDDKPKRAKSAKCVCQGKE